METIDSGLNELVKAFLTSWDGLGYAKYFKGLDKSTFLKLSLEDLREMLAEEEDGNAVAQIISNELLRFSKLADEHEASGNNTGLRSNIGITTPNNGPVSSAASSAQTRVLSAEQPEAVEEDVKPKLETELLDPLNVARLLKEESCTESDSESDYYDNFIPPEPAAPKIVEEILLESDSEMADPSNVSHGYSLRTRQTPRKYVPSGSSSEDDSIFDDDAITDPDYIDSKGHPPKRSKLTEFSGPRRKPEKPVVIRSPEKNMARNSYVIIAPENTGDCHSCDPDDPLENELQPWTDLYAHLGPYVHFLDLDAWSWRAPDSKCPFNLVKILENFGNLRELCLTRRILPVTLENFPLPPTVSLRSLMKLSLNHSGEIVYYQPLKFILNEASRLQSFECWFHNLEEANEILDLLRDVSSLRSLTFQSHSQEDYITREQIKKLAKIRAVNLEKLEIGDGFWEDVDGECLENLLGQFSGLKELIMSGSFQGSSRQKPDIIIRIPPMPSLEILDIGSNYDFASLYQCDEDSVDRVVTVGDDLTTEFFSVTLKFPLLPSLEALNLGNLFKIDELHFSSFPALRVFQVGSPWHLAVKFPENTKSRKFSYPLVTVLQLPDCLRDPSFIRNIPIRFPNLETCTICLASVKVLRTFFKSMENGGLKCLCLDTQYDFEATMELCLLVEPSKASKKLRDYIESKKYEELERYGKLEEFLQFYNIELPSKTIEEGRDLEGGTYAGIGALRNLETLEIRHIPRVLRMPKGNLHWTHADAEFSENFIGFEKYPISGNCLRALPKQTVASWKNCEVEGDEEALGGRGVPPASGSETKTQMQSGPEKRLIEIQPAVLQASMPFREKKEKD